MRNIHVVAVFAALVAVSQPAHAIERQRATNWCWAAVIQEVIASAGGSRSQEQIAADLDGWPRDRPALLSEVMSLLAAYGLRASEIDRPATLRELYQTLQAGFYIVALVSPSGGNVGHYILIKTFN